jgi:hypothetical protein
MVRERSRHEIEAGRAEGMTAAEACQRHPPTRPQAEAIDRLIGIARACRQMPTFESDQSGERVAIDLDQTSREQRRATDEVCQNVLVISLHH